MEIEYLYEAVEELKRVDHLVYVSLKYTRTVDVIKSVLERLINFYDFAFLALLHSAKIKKLIQDYPNAPRARAETVAKIYHLKDELPVFVDIYMKIRMVNRAEYTRSQEFRKNVTMTAMVDEGPPVDITIAVLLEHYDKAKSFLPIIKRIVLEDND